MAVAAGKIRQAAVGAVQHAVANVAFFYALHLLVDVALPEQDGRDDVAVARLDQVSDRERPLAKLTSLKLELVC